MTTLLGATSPLIESVLAESVDPVFVVGADGRIVEVNPAAAAARFRVGGHAIDVFDGADRAAFEGALARARAGESARFEWGERYAGVASRWYATTTCPIRRDGQVAGVLCVSVDATELKRSEERLRRTERLMVDTQGVTHMGTWEWDVSQPTATWSAELFRIYGLSPDSYVPSYESYLTMVHPDDRQRVVDATNRVFNDHVPYSHDERIFCPDGSMRYLHTWAYPVLDDAGKLDRLIGVCQDITDRKLAEEQVRELAADLERRVAERTRTIESSMRDLEAFNSMVSHDLRAPLQVIQLCSTAIGRVLDERPADARPFVERIDRAVERMTALVDALLALARLGSQPLEQVDVDLGAIALELLEDLRRADARRAVEVLVEPDLRCRGDARLLHAVMQNLVENAWKYSAHADPARIEIGKLERDGQPAFYVRDNGIGFHEEEAPLLFAPFTRLSGAADFSGTGIGLATVHRIVERHGGRVWAEGEPGRGATFLFELPE